MKQSLSFMLTSLIALVGATSSRNVSFQNTTKDAAPSTVEMRSEHLQLNASMTDAEILASFGLDINDTEAIQVQGKDGLQITYVLDNRSVSVIRSKVSGISVIADNTNPAGAWLIEEEALASTDSP